MQTSLCHDFINSHLKLAKISAANPKCEGSEEYDEGQPLNNKCGVVTDGSVSLITHPAVKSVDVDSFDEVAIRLDEPASQKLDGVCALTHFKCPQKLLLNFREKH